MRSVEIRPETPISGLFGGNHTRNVGFRARLPAITPEMQDARLLFRKSRKQGGSLARNARVSRSARTSCERPRDHTKNAGSSLASQNSNVKMREHGNSLGISR